MNITTTSDNGTWWKRPSYSSIYDATGGFDIFNTVSIILMNTLLIFTIASSNKLRARFPNQVILSVAVCNWLYGAVWCPMKADYTFTRRWRFGCWMHVAYQLFEQYVQTFVTAWFVVIYNTHYVIERAKVRGVAVSKNKLFAFRLGVLATPWISSAFFVLPLAMTNLHPVWNQSVWTATHCAVILKRWADILLPCVCFFLPATFVTIQSLYIVLTLGSQDRSSAMMTSWDRSLRRKISYCVIIASVVTVLFNLGDQVCVVIEEMYNWNDQLHVITWYALDVLADFQKVALPLVWVFLPDISEELNLKIKWWIGRSYLSEDTVEVRYYRNYVHT